MNVILSWVFLILSPVSFLSVVYITFKKLEGNIIIKLLSGIFLGALIGFIMFYISAFIGMNLN